MHSVNLPKTARMLRLPSFCLLIAHPLQGDRFMDKKEAPIQIFLQNPKATAKTVCRDLLLVSALTFKDNSRII